MIVRTRPSIILFGDSITQQGFSGWVSRLSDAYTRRADVLNRGYSGYNTRHALDMLPYVFGPDCNAEDDKTDNVLMVTVFFGANDASLPGDREHCQHVPIDEYESNLRKIVKSIRAKLPKQVIEQKVLSPPILLFTPPPIDAKKWDKCCLETFNDTSPRANPTAKAYGDRVKCIANDMDCITVDSFALLGGDHEQGEAFYGQHLEDGLHLNELGNKRLYEGLIDTIRRELPDIAPMEDGEGRYGVKGIPLQGKLWKELC